MLSVELIEKLVNQNLEGTEKFLVDVNVTSDSHIYVYLDSDEDLTVSDCIRVSRYIESNLDRDKEDFELLVSSSGLDKGFKVKRQYIKNIGREVQVILESGEKKAGILIAVDDNEIELEVLPPENKKKKITVVTGNIKLLLKDIKETKAVISFKKRKKQII